MEVDRGEDQLEDIQRRLQEENNREQELEKKLQQNRYDQLDASRKEAQEKKRMLHEKLEAEQARQEEAAKKRRIEETPEEQIARLKQELKVKEEAAADFGEELDKLATRDAGRTLQILQGGDLLKGFLWKLAGGRDPAEKYPPGQYRALVEKYKPPELIRVVWADYDEIEARLVQSGMDDGEVRKKAREIWRWLDDVLRKTEPPPRELDRGRGETRTDYFSPFKRMQGEIVGRNLEDPHIQKAKDKYGVAIQDYLFEAAKDVDTYSGSGRFPVDIFWNYAEKREMGVDEVVAKVMEYVETVLTDYDAQLDTPGTGHAGQV